MFPCLSSSVPEPADEYDPLPFGLRWRMKWGKHDHDPHTGRDVIRLGSNRLIETHCAQTEYQALRLVDRHTSVPAYKVIAIFNRPEGKLVEYEAIPGQPLSHRWHEMETPAKKRIIADLGRFVEQLRKMDPPKHFVIGDATLGAALDPRFGGRGTVGPFYTIEAFHRFERRGHPIQDFDEAEVAECHERDVPYVLKFTHANLNPKNILVDDAGRVSAVIGWEGAGWYPEYWEYTQMHHGCSTEFEDWLEMMDGVVPRYPKELAVDEILRRKYPSASYDRPLSVRPPSPSPSELAREQKEIDDKNTESTSG